MVAFFTPPRKEEAEGVKRREEEVETDVVFGGTAVGTEATDSFVVQRLRRHKAQGKQGDDGGSSETGRVIDTAFLPQRVGGTLLPRPRKGLASSHLLLPLPFM